MAESMTGILIPIPQYPLYSATITLCGGTAVPYYLDESKDWAANLKSIEDAINNAKDITIRAIAVINPGNPTVCTFIYLIHSPLPTHSLFTVHCIVIGISGWNPNPFFDLNRFLSFYPLKRDNVSIKRQSMAFSHWRINIILS